jgi:hypothetical protein
VFISFFVEIFMAQANVPFDKRLKRIVRRHDRMQNGVVKTVMADGLIVERPRVYRPKLPLQGLLVAVVLCFLFKGMVFVSLGADQYAERVAQLQQGTMVEQASAWIMFPDQATVFIAEAISTSLP